MKKYIYIFITLILLGTGCTMLKNEAERSIKKDIKEYLDENFDSYAKEYHDKKTKEFKSHFGWLVGIVGSLVAITGGTIGIINVSRKLKKQKTEDNNSDYFEKMKKKNG